MRYHGYLAVLRTGAVVAGSLLLVASTARAAETFTANASVKTAAGASASAPMTVTIDRFADDSERDALLKAVKNGGTPAAHEMLKGGKDVGTLQLGGRSTAIKYAYARAMGASRLITVVTCEPIVYLGAGLPEPRAKAEYKLALAVFEVNDAGTGSGELSPASKVKVNEQGAVVTEDYGADVVRLTKVAKK